MTLHYNTVSDRINKIILREAGIKTKGHKELIYPLSFIREKKLLLTNA